MEFALGRACAASALVLSWAVDGSARPWSTVEAGVDFVVETPDIQREAG